MVFKGEKDLSLFMNYVAFLTLLIMYTKISRARLNCEEKGNNGVHKKIIRITCCKRNKYTFITLYKAMWEKKWKNYRKM